MSDFEWFRSSFCASGACVEVAVSEFGDVLVRDSKLGKESPVQQWSPDGWGNLLNAVKSSKSHACISSRAGGVGIDSGISELFFTPEEWISFVAGVRNGEFDLDKLFSGDEAGSGFRGVARSGQAATGAGAIAVPPVPVAANPCTCPPPTAGGIVGVNRGHLLGCPELTGDVAAPVAAQPRYILDKDAILNLALRLADTAVAAALERRSCNPDAASRYDAKFDELLAAIGAALTPVPDVEPEPAWGSGPLVKHVTETPAVSRPPEPSYPAGICRCGADGHGPGDNLCVCRPSGGA